MSDDLFGLDSNEEGSYSEFESTFKYLDDYLKLVIYIRKNGLLSLCGEYERLYSLPVGFVICATAIAEGIDLKTVMRILKVLKKNIMQFRDKKYYKLTKKFLKYLYTGESPLVIMDAFEKIYKIKREEFEAWRG